MEKIYIVKKICIGTSLLSAVIEFIFFISLFQENFVFPSWIIYIFPIGFAALMGWLFCLQYLNKKDNIKMNLTVNNSEGNKKSDVTEKSA